MKLARTLETNGSSILASLLTMKSAGPCYLVGAVVLSGSCCQARHYEHAKGDAIRTAVLAGYQSGGRLGEKSGRINTFHPDGPVAPAACVRDDVEGKNCCGSAEWSQLSLGSIVT